MVTENNSQINTFTGGMDSDTAISLVKEDSYLEARNIRVTNYNSTNGDSTNQQGEIRPIQGIEQAYFEKIEGLQRILATGSVRNIGVIVYLANDKLCVARFDNAIGNGKDNSDEFSKITKFYTIFRSDLYNWEKDKSKWPKRISISFRWENDNNVKLYMADTFNPVMILNIAAPYWVNLQKSMKDIISYPKVIFNKPVFVEYIAGLLKPALVAYSYQLYTKHGAATDISPACKLIPIGNFKDKDTTNILQIRGSKQDAQTNSGCKIKINIYKQKGVQQQLDQLRVYRITYQQNGQLPTIDIIYDGTYSNSEFIFDDTGATSLDTISVEEYNSMSGVHIIPKVIENKNDFMFAANIKNKQSTESFGEWDARAFRFNSEHKCVIKNYYGEDTYEFSADDINIPDGLTDCFAEYNDINEDYTLDKAQYVLTKDGQYYGGSGKNIEWKFVVMDIFADGGDINRQKIVRNKVTTNPTLNYIKPGGTLIASGVSLQDGMKNNPYLAKSLRRNELYRYGIILYDQFGFPSPVKWIADIRTPNLYEKGFETFTYTKSGSTDELYTRPLGIVFTVNNIPDDCTAYEIVRCARGEADVATVSQGVVSKPIKNIYTRGYEGIQHHVFTPTGFLTTATIVAGLRNKALKSPDAEKDQYDEQLMENFTNTSLLQFVSPEVVYQPEAMKLLAKDKQFNIDSLTYLYPDAKTPSSAKGRNFIYPAPYNANMMLNEEDLTYYGDGDSISLATIKDKIIVIPSLYAWEEFYTRQASDNVYFGYTNVDGKSRYSESFAVVANSAHAFIKLYNKADNVIAGVRNNKGTVVTDVTSVPSVSSTVVKNFSISSNLEWYQMFETTTDKDGNINGTKSLYMDYTGGIGVDQFCNVVTNGGYGFAATNIEDGLKKRAKGMFLQKWGDKMTFGYLGGTEKTIMGNEFIAGSDNYKKRAFSFIMGLGGATALLNVQDAAKALIDPLGISSSPDNSIMGTQLCNLRKKVTPYNGYDANSRSLNTYSADGDYFTKDQNTAVVFDGDTYIGLLDYTSMHKYKHLFGQAISKKDKDQEEEKDSEGNVTVTVESHATFMDTCYGPTFMIQYSIPVESSINLMFTHGWEFSKNYNNDSQTYIQQQPANIIDAYVQDEPEYVYNTAYSTENKSRTHAAYDESNPDDLNKNVDYRCYYSKLKENDENIDSWTKYQSSNFLDADSKYGPITNMRAFKDKLIFWQQQATGVFAVNQQALTTDDNTGAQLILGTGGVLSRYDYIDNTAGMHEGQFCDTQSDSSLYWFDDHNNEIKAFGEGGAVSLTKQLRVQNLMNKYKSNDVKQIFFNRKNNEIIASVLDERKAIVYNERQRAFTSIYTIPFSGSCQFNNGEYVVNSDSNTIRIAQWEGGTRERPTTWGNMILPCYIEYVVNKNPITTKVFDNQEIMSPCTLEYPEVEDRWSFFSRTHSYEWKTDLNRSSSDLHDDITLRENNYRFAIPRADGLYGNRIRGKYMIASIYNDKPYKGCGIQYILTKFRTSWT